MIGFADFFASVAGRFRDHYQNLAAQLELDRTPQHFRSDEQEAEEAAPVQPVDTYEPSGEAPTATEDENPPVPAESSDDTEVKPAGENDETPSQPPVEQNPDGTYFTRRTARMDYRMDLQFDLAAFTQTVERIADGETVQIDEIAAAGFGLSADFAIQGKQTVETNRATDSREDVRHLLAKSRGRSRQAGAFQVNTRNFALDSFFKQAADIRRSLDVKNFDGYTRTVNKFASRFSLDTQFSFGFAQRFHVQTQRVADEMPEQVGNYLESAGTVAEAGTPEMMATFFDGVDAYLDKAEDEIIENVMAQFEAAAAELGFDGALVETARAQLTASVEGFFDRVDTAVAQIRNQFVPSAGEQVESEVAEIPESQPIDYNKTDVAAEQTEMAMA